MVITTTTLNAIRDAAIDYINDNFTHIAVGDNNTTPSPSDTALGNEFLRKTFQETDTLTPGQIILSMRISTTEGNGNTIKEVGVFDAGAGGNMATRNLTTEYAKTSSKEVWIDVTIVATALNG